MAHDVRVAALSLGAANAIDFGLQFLLPVLLARALNTTDFGVYRLFWLVTSTALALSTFGIPQSLYYFLPRSDAPAKRIYIKQAMLFLAFGGLLAAAAVLPGSPVLVDNSAALGQYGLLTPTFVTLWIVSTLLDFLPTADGRSVWQAKAIVGLSVARTLMLGGAAILTGDVGTVLWALMGFVLIKTYLLVAYIARYHGVKGPFATKAAFREQTGYAIPFGVAGMFFSLRAQADQWVAATLFTISQYAAFSVASVLAPLISLFRQSMNQAFLPKMSRLQADGDAALMLQINNQVNVALALLLFPVLAYAFAFSTSLVSLIYTQAYAEGGDVMRVYVLGMVAFTVEVNNVMLLLKEGSFAARVNFVMLCVGVVVSFLLAYQIGLAGAATGSVLAVYLDRIWTLRRMSKRLMLPMAALQDWWALGKILLAAATSAAVAWVATAAMPQGLHIMNQLGLAAGMLMATYVAALWLIGMWPIVRGFATRRR